MIRSGFVGRSFGGAWLECYNGIFVAAEKGSVPRADYILLALFLGGLGGHNYYAGYRGKAEIQLVGTMLGLLVGLFIFRDIAFSIVVAVWVVLDIFCVEEDTRGIPFK